MKHCIIITGYIEGSIRAICPEAFNPISAEDPALPLILCADGGYRLASKEGLIPHVIIGDFDTFDGMQEDQPEVRSEAEIRGEILRVPVEKDDTDTLLCIKYALEQGCDHFTIVGGLGGRLDHTFANLQSLAYLTALGKDAVLKDEETCVMIKAPGNHVLHRQDDRRPYRRFSLFSWSPAVEGLSIRDAKYELENGRLEHTYPLGVSNEFLHEEVHLAFEEGLLLIIQNHLR
ncbi:MAG: thiamine diphosphokinase [Firmicutes bacterium]|nr:thiamine diphosphokinase [Bacillota bacterium]